MIATVQKHRASRWFACWHCAAADGRLVKDDLPPEFSRVAYCRIPTAVVYANGIVISLANPHAGYVM